MCYIFIRYWQCVKRAQCNARLHTVVVCDDTTEVSEIDMSCTVHNHEPDDEQYIRSAAVATLREKIKSDPTRPMSAIYDELAAQHTDDDLLPTFNSVRSAMRRERAVGLPNLPKSCDKISTEGEWGQTADGKRFRLPVNNCNNDMLIFATDDDLACLSQCKTIYIDGTFKTCPSLFTQLFTIHGLYRDVVVPFVYVLLADKRADTYYRVINIIRDALAVLGCVFDPEIVISDFESGFIEAVRIFSFFEADL